MGRGLPRAGVSRSFADQTTGALEDLSKRRKSWQARFRVTTLEGDPPYDHAAGTRPRPRVGDRRPSTRRHRGRSRSRTLCAGTPRPLHGLLRRLGQPSVERPRSRSRVGRRRLCWIPSRTRALLRPGREPQGHLGARPRAALGVHLRHLLDAGATERDPPGPRDPHDVLLTEEVTITAPKRGQPPTA